MKHIFGLIAMLSLILSGCVEEKAPGCGLWKLEINNPEASVKVENGRLIVDIPNPKTFKDVRLIQQQADGELHPEVGLWFNGTLDATSLTQEDAYAEMRFSFGYQAGDGATFLGLAVNSEGHRKAYVNEQSVYSSKTGTYFFRAEGTSAYFEKNHDINPLQIPQISAAAKVFYIDFGVDPAIAHHNPIASLHAEVDFIKFGDHVLTPFDESELRDIDKQKLGFRWDEFDCNSLIN